MIPVEVLNAWGTTWSGLMTWALIDTSALLALILVVWLPLRRRMSAQLAHGLFCLVLLKLIIPVPITGPWLRLPAWARPAAERVYPWAHPGDPIPVAAALPAPPAPWVLPATGDVGASLADVSSPQPVGIAEPAPAPAGTVAKTKAHSLAPRPAAPVSLSISACLMLVWAFCATILLARFLWAVVATRRLLRQAVPLRRDWLPIDVDALRRAVGLRTTVRWAVNARLDSPAVGGLVWPAVVIPPDLSESLTPNQLTWVLLHELAHVRRGDLWVVVVQRVAQAVFFFNPAVHLANWIIDELREYACDDAALSACKTSRRDCGEGFLAIIERSSGLAPTASPALGLFEGRMLIRRRLVRILDNHRTVHARMSRPAAFGLLMLALGLFALPYLAPRDVAAGPHNGIRSPRDRGMSLAEPASGPDEPATYRPGRVWHPQAPPDQDTARGERVSPNGRAVVLALAYSPDGSMLASAGDDGVVRLRDLASGRVQSLLAGHRDTVSCVAFSPDGKTLATGSYDRTVKLWDVASRRLRATLTGHTNWVFSVAFAPDGASLASAGHDKTVRIWDAAAGRETATLLGHSASVRAVAFAPGPNATILASGGADQLVLVWDLRARSPRARLEGHTGMVRALAFAPDGATLATGGEDGEVRLWDMASFRLRAALSGHTDMVTCLAFSPRGGILATGSLDATVKLWETNAGRERASLQGHVDGVAALAFAPAAQQMATGGFDGSVRLWEPAAPIFSPSACLSYPGEPRSLAFAPDSRFLRAAGAAGIVRWDVRTGLAGLPTGKGEATAVAAALDGARYATGGTDGEVLLIDAVSDELLATFEGHAGAVRSVAFSADSRLLASGDQNGIVRLWDATTHHPLGPLPALRLPVTCVQFSPDGRTLAAATGDERESSPGTVTVWDVATRRELGTLEGHEGSVTSVAFSPDGATIATAGADGFVRLWDTATRSPRSSLQHSGCRSVAFSPDGRSLASAHQEGDVVLWDARSGRQLGLLKGHSDQVHQVVFSPDGRSLATAGKDRTVKLWSLATRRQTARATLKGDVTPVWSVAYSPDGKTLAVADGLPDAPGTVTLWDVATRKVKATLDGHERGVATVVFSPEGTRLASGGWDGTIRIWDVQTGAQRQALTGINCVTDLSFSRDGRLLASAGEGNVVTLWDVENGTEAFRLADFRWPVQCVAFSPDGTLLVTGGGTPDNRPGGQGELKVWDVAKRTLLTTLDGHTRAVLAIAFTPDGAGLATGGLDETIRLWDVPTGRHQLALGGLSNCVQALAFSPDGRILASSGRTDGLVSLRDATTGAEVIRLVGHSAVVQGIAFAPDGTGLATGGNDRTIKLWDVPAYEPSWSLSAKR